MFIHFEEVLCGDFFDVGASDIRLHIIIYQTFGEHLVNQLRYQRHDQGHLGKFFISPFDRKLELLRFPGKWIAYSVGEDP